MIALVNYADKTFRNKQKWNTISAKLLARFDMVFEYSPNDLEKNILEKNKESVKYQKKGAGNYFWKPYIVNKAFKKMNEGDFLMYADSGSVFLKNIKPLIIFMEKKQKEILCFQLPLIERQWTKRDTFLLMDCDTKKFTETVQTLATFFIVKKGEKAKQFLDEYQKYCSDSRILSDDANVLGKENYKEFIAHRHDQSVLSLLSKKNKDVLLIKDISDYGYYPYRYILDSNRLYDKNYLETKDNLFKSTILSTRNQNIIIYFFKYLVRRSLLLIQIKK